MQFCGYFNFVVFAIAGEVIEILYLPKKICVHGGKTERWIFREFYLRFLTQAFNCEKDTSE